MKQYRKLKGFTLIEMIIVLAIIGVLIGILAPTMSTYYWKSRVKDANADAKMVYNAAQTAVQKYISIDRVKAVECGAVGSATSDQKSRFSTGGDLIMEYNAATHRITCMVMDASDPTNNTPTYTFSSFGPDEALAANAEENVYQDVARQVFRTVSDSDTTNWAIYIRGYIVRSAVSCNNRGSRNVGYYTNGTITVERIAGSYESNYISLLHDYATSNTNGYEQPVHPPVLATEAST